MVDRAARESHEVHEVLERERLPDLEVAAEHPGAQLLEGGVILRELETPELPAKVGQRCARARGGAVDLGQEDGVRPAGDLLDDAALERREGVAEQRLAVRP